MKNSIITYPTVLKILPVFLLLSLVLFYWFGLRKTIEAYMTYQSFSPLHPEFSKLSISPTYTNTRAQEVQKQYYSFKVDPLNWKNSLWNTLIRLSQQHNCNVIAYPAVKSGAVNEVHVNKQVVVLSGRFFDLLMLLRDLEKIKNQGKLSSLSFIKKDQDKQVSLKIVMASVKHTQNMEL